MTGFSGPTGQRVCRPGPRLRVRLVLHHGTLIAGPFGPAGDAPIVASRLLEARPLRLFLARHPGDDLAFAVSGSLFHDVVRTGFCCLDPAAFDPMRITAKGITYHGYLHHGIASGHAASPPASAAVQIRAAPTSGQPLGRRSLV